MIRPMLEVSKARAVHDISSGCRLCTLLDHVHTLCLCLCPMNHVTLHPHRYVERLSSSLRRKSGQEAKMLAAAAETQARQQESRATLASLQPKVGGVDTRVDRLAG